jgi:hypothetical protein
VPSGVVVFMALNPQKLERNGEESEDVEATFEVVI